MKIGLSSEWFSLDHAKVHVIDVDWEEHLVASPTAEPDIPVLSLANGRIDWPTPSPGDFHFLLHELAVTRVSDSAQFVIPHFLVPFPISITVEDIQRGSAEFSVQTRDIFRLTVTNAGPVISPRREIRFFHPLEGSLGLNANLRLDESGQTLWLGNPTMAKFDIDADTRFLIEPV